MFSDALHVFQILKRDDYCCLISGKRDDYALGLVAGKTEIDGQGYRSFDPLPLAPWFRHKEERETVSIASFRV